MPPKKHQYMPLGSYETAVTYASHLRSLNRDIYTATTMLYNLEDLYFKDFDTWTHLRKTKILLPCTLEHTHLHSDGGLCLEYPTLEDQQKAGVCHWIPYEIVSTLTISSETQA